MSDAPYRLLLGSDAEGQPIFLDKDDATRHAFVVGATGAGKTNMLLGMAASAIAGGSGLVFVDGKADLSVYTRIMAIAERCGRADDVMLLNFAATPRKGDARKITNTVDPFADVHASGLISMIVNMLEKDGYRDGMWQNRAIGMISPVLRALVWLRDAKGFLLSASSIQDHLSMRNIVRLADKDLHPDMPVNLRRALQSYLLSIPGFQPERGYKQSQVAHEQHGYLQMQYTRILGCLVDDYGHVFSEGGGDVSFLDLHRNRRILVVLLPVLGSSAIESQYIGQIVVGLLKDLMGRLQDPGKAMLGETTDLSGPPTVVILDEFAHYCPPGVEAIVSQGRSLGFSFVFSTQTLVPSPSDRDGIILDNVLANTATKILMRTDLVDKMRLVRIVPALDQFDHDNGYMALVHRMQSIGNFVSMSQRSGTSPELEPVLEEYRQLMEEQNVFLKTKKSLAAVTGLQSLATGEMIVVRGGVPIRSRAYDSNPLGNLPGRVLDGHSLSVADLLAMARSWNPEEELHQPGIDQPMFALPMAYLPALPGDGETLGDVDAVRLAAACCLAAGLAQKEITI